ncbi:hypothetical protein LPB41_01450 [Thalassospira sp. MA62]|nr:hypothetical protein [Thalassospira sp. MA62]
MRKWFCHVCPGVDRRALRRDLSDQAAPGWFATDRIGRRVSNRHKAGKYRGLLIAVPAAGLRGVDYVSQLGAYVHQLGARFQSIGRPIVLLLCGAGDRDIAHSLGHSGVLPSGRGVVGWLGENVHSGIRALTLASNYQADIAGAGNLIAGASYGAGRDQRSVQEALPGCVSVLRGLEFLVETARPSWQPSGIFITGDRVGGDVASARLVRLYDELERFAGPEELFTWTRGDGVLRKGLLVTTAVLAVMVGAGAAWQQGAVLRNILKTPVTQEENQTRLWSLVETLDATHGSDLMAAIPGTPFETIGDQIGDLADTVLLAPARVSFDRSLAALEKTALTGDPQTVVDRSAALLSDLAVYLNGPAPISRPSGLGGLLSRSDAPLSGTTMGTPPQEADPWWSLMVRNGLMADDRMSDVSPVFSDIVMRRLVAGSAWSHDVVARVQSLLETVVGYEWGVGRGPEIVAAGQRWQAIETLISEQSGAVTGETIRSLLAAHATVVDSRTRLAALSSKTGDIADPLFARIATTPLLDQSWLLGLRMRATLEIEAALNQIELSASYGSSINQIGHGGSYGSAMIAQLVSLNEDGMGRRILDHIGTEMTHPTAVGLPSGGDLMRAQRLGDYFAKMHNRAGAIANDGPISELLLASTTATISDLLFGQDTAPRHLAASNYADYFTRADQMLDMAQSYSTEFSEDFRWAYTVTAMRELERIDSAGRNLMNALEAVLPAQDGGQTGPDPATVESHAKVPSMAMPGAIDLGMVRKTARDLDILAGRAGIVLGVIARLDDDGFLGRAPAVMRWNSGSENQETAQIAGSDQDDGAPDQTQSADLCQIFGSNLPLALALGTDRFDQIMTSQGCNAS